MGAVRKAEFRRGVDGRVEVKVKRFEIFVGRPREGSEKQKEDCGLSMAAHILVGSSLFPYRKG